MAHGMKNRMAYWISAVLLCTQNGYTHAGPATTRQLSYLPPIPGVSDQTDSVQQGSSTVETQQKASYPSSYTATSYNTNHISPDTFQTSPQLSNHKSVSSYTRTYYNSYVPQPSGVGKHLPQPPTPAPLPSLIPKSVLDQFAFAAKSAFPSSSRGNSIDSGISAQSSNRAKTPVQDSLSLPVPTLSPSLSPPALGLGGSESSQPPTNGPSQSFIMFDNPPSVLTPSQNETIYAAKLLATSLLQATGDGPVDKLDGFNVVDTNNIKENNLNSTDVVIVKSQKNAYIIPMQLPTGEKKPMAIEELYNTRDKLSKAYTINQFIFIIKPERINFLNKLV